PGKRVLIHGEQGFGDIIQFIRYLPSVKERCGEVIFFETGRVIYDLLTTDDEDGDVDEDLEAHASDSAILTVDYDYQIPLLSLPRVFGTTVDSVPWDGPYLHPSPKRVAKWEKCIGDFA